MSQQLPAFFTCFGLALTAAGAGIAADGIFITRPRAKRIASRERGRGLAATLYLQSRKAKLGLQLVVGGTIIQILATLPQIWG